MNSADITIWQCGDRTLDLHQTVVMGILNVTPDSFSDGGRFSSTAAAVEAGLAMLREGAQVVDIGGESTRPGAEPVPLELELERTLPVIAGLRAREDCMVSIDTMKAEVAREAISAGARIINDVSALGADPAMAGVVAESGAGVVLMHMRGTPRTMQSDPVYEDVVREVGLYLSERLAVGMAAGIEAESVVLDPGVGFGKTFEHNLELFQRMEELVALPRPLLVGASRKAFLGRITGARVEARQPETLAAVTAAVLAGVKIVRVHDVEQAVRAVRVAERLRKPPPA